MTHGNRLMSELVAFGRFSCRQAILAMFDWIYTLLVLWIGQIGGCLVVATGLSRSASPRESVRTRVFGTPFAPSWRWRGPCFDALTGSRGYPQPGALAPVVMRASDRPERASDRAERSGYFLDSPIERRYD